MITEIKTKKVRGIFKRYITKIIIDLMNQAFEGISKDYVCCSNCGIVVRRNKAYKTKTISWVTGAETKYYCDRHKKNYDRMLNIYNRDIIFYKDNVEVDKNGKIITKRKP
jgi:hypothetical protein